MLVLKTTSPSLSPRAPKAVPVKTVPSSSASFAMSIESPQPFQDTQGVAPDTQGVAPDTQGVALDTQGVALG